jgi:glycosyltransferase involved in cell wall biosynthesis
MPLFSIIVPVFKTEKYLEKCVTSILRQTYKDFELILVDDGSPDNCPQMCDDYAANDSRVMVIHKDNGGVSSARNCGIEAAIGTYIWFVDSDDYIEPYSLEQLYNAQKKEQADIYFFNTSGVNGLDIGSFDDFLENYYFTYVVGFGPWNKLYKTSIIKKNKLYFDVEETVGEDLLFNLSYYKVIYGGASEKRFFTLAGTIIFMLTV